MHCGLPTTLVCCSGQSEGAARLTAPAQRLLEKRREIFQVQNELDEQKVLYQAKVPVTLICAAAHIARIAIEQP